MHHRKEQPDRDRGEAVAMNGGNKSDGGIPGGSSQQADGGGNKPYVNRAFPPTTAPSSERFVLTIEALPARTPAGCRLKALLKLALRGYRLKCIRCEPSYPN